ncbi:aminoglycoside phosphotransferase family protein [Catenuloplanes japonicus]|uniref:aminoglycoside phosphotransferase family protein n=1 Tax=Catenuloplanes japonicus TaxID=33876 RepID=UPI000524FA10|nr:aminoglycoside phosphotransferase family protein [Catenuloplanes japonicus]
MALHEDEVPAGEAVVRGLLVAQCPEWAELPLSRAGAGTDNTMYRLGDELLVRMPRRPFTAGMLVKERHWLPRLAPHLTVAIPEPVHEGAPTDAFPLPWSVYRWIDGDEAGPGTVRDWGAFGRDLAEFVNELHGTDLMGATRDGDLSWYRGGLLRDCDDWVSPGFAACEGLVSDVPTLERLWREALTLPDPVAPHTWLHADLKPTNLLVRDGALHAVIDFAGIAVGFPDAEHAPVWDLPPEARDAYWNVTGLDDLTWQRARAWAIAPGVSGLSYYRESFPEFAEECRARLESIIAGAR